MGRQSPRSEDSACPCYFCRLSESTRKILAARAFLEIVRLEYPAMYEIAAAEIRAHG